MTETVEDLAARCRSQALGLVHWSDLATAEAAVRALNQAEFVTQRRFYKANPGATTTTTLQQLAQWLRRTHLVDTRSHALPNDGLPRPSVIAVQMQAYVRRFDWGELRPYDEIDERDLHPPTHGGIAPPRRISPVARWVREWEALGQGSGDLAQHAEDYIGRPLFLAQRRNDLLWPLGDGDLQLLLEYDFRTDWLALSPSSRSPWAKYFVERKAESEFADSWWWKPTWRATGWPM